MESSSQTLTKNGRAIRIIQAGDLAGKPVLVHNGTPGSRLLYSGWVDDAQERGIRLISYDRPGYGGSTPQPGRSVADAAEDVAFIAQALVLERLATWGVSGGGPHALACAALLPELVVAAAVLGSVAPYDAKDIDWMAGMGQDNIVEFGAALESRQAIEAFVEAATPGTLGTDAAALVEEMQTLLCPADVDVLTEAYARYLIGVFHEGIQQRRDGWIDDDLAFVKPWGFEVSNIRIPILVVHGEQDQFVPFAHGQWLAHHIPGVETRFLPDDGHLTLSVRRVPEVHAWLVNKM